MDSEHELVERLRDRILNALHVGSLQPGARLPSIRTLWREMGVDHRVVANAYRILEAEGLVEVRGRSGVYVARQDQLGGEVLAETARWLAGVMVEGWKRHISIGEVAELIRRCTTRRLLCACVESNVDQMTVYRAEIEEQFGMETVPIYVSPSPLPRPARSIEYAALQEALRGVDLAVTTSYHSRMVRHAAESVGTAAVTLTVNGQVVDAIQRRLQTGTLTVVAVDERFGDRIRTMYGGAETGDRIRIVLAEDSAAVSALDPAEPVVLTRAARAALQGPPPPLLFPHSPTISSHTARELMEAIIRLNLSEARLPTASADQLS